MSQEATEGNSVVLHCELNKHAPSVEWRREGETLKNGDKYQIRKKDLQAEMKITDLTMEDTGDYSCVCGEERTTARIEVNGQFLPFFGSHTSKVRSFLCLKTKLMKFFLKLFQSRGSMQCVVLQPFFFPFLACFCQATIENRTLFLICLRWTNSW